MKIFDFESDNYLFDYDAEEFTIFDILKFKDVYYVLAFHDLKTDFYYVRKLNLDIEGKDQDFKNYITCPYCEYKNHNSCDKDAEEEEDYECARCRCFFSYERQIIVNYSSYPKKDEYDARKNRIILVDSKEQNNDR